MSAAQIADVFFLSYFAALNAAYLGLIGIALGEILRRKATRLPEHDAYLATEESTPPISILAPAHNEASVVVESVKSLLQIEYGQLQVIVINDGSVDATLAVLQDAFALEPFDLVVRSELQTRPIRGIYRSELDPRLIVVDKEQGGKADSLNVGLNVARTPLVCAIDADTVVDRSALHRMVEPFLYDPDQVVAVGGMVRVANGCTIEHGRVERVKLPRSWLARFQIVEYLRGFTFGRMGFNRLGGNVIVSGAFGMFARDAVVSVGGYAHDTVGEDMELILRLHRNLRERGTPYRIVHISDPVCYTEVPERVGQLGRQRDRWQRGLADSLWRHRRMFMRPRYGGVGMIAFPFFVIFELLGPIVELSGYIWFAILLARQDYDTAFAVLYGFMAFGLGILLSVQSLVLDDVNARFFRGFGQRIRLLVVAVFENIGYRQMTAYFRIRGLISFLLGRRGWGAQHRQGFEGPKAAAGKAASLPEKRDD